MLRKGEYFYQKDKTTNENICPLIQVENSLNLFKKRNNKMEKIF